MKILKVNFGGKCSDCAYIGVSFEDGTHFEKDGYVAKVSGVGGGDYYDFTVDNETGRIIGWVPLEDSEIHFITKDM